MLQEALFKKLSVLGAVFSLAVSSIFFVQGAWMFGLGVWVSASWIFLNFYFLFRMLQIGFEPRVRKSDRILILSILKFPVLYVAGFFILQSRTFPIYSILTGLSLFVLAMVIVWVKASVSPQGQVNS